MPLIVGVFVYVSTSLHTVVEGQIYRARVNQPPMTAPVGRSVHRMGWMIRLFFIRLFFIRLFTFHYPTFYRSQSFLAADL
jgi:hypothetical protein